MDNAKPSLYTGPCRGRCRNRPQWVKAAGWQKQEGALGPPGPSPIPADLPEGVPRRAVLCPSHGADQAYGLSLVPAQGLRGWWCLNPQQPEYQGHDGVERGEGQNVCSCLSMNTGLGRNWLWFHIITQDNITDSRHFSRLMLVYLSSAIMIRTKLLKILQGPALWALLHLIFQTVIGSQRQISPWTRRTKSQKKHFSKNSRIMDQSVSTLISWVWKLDISKEN